MYSVLDARSRVLNNHSIRGKAVVGVGGVMRGGGAARRVSLKGVVFVLTRCRPASTIKLSRLLFIIAVV